MVDWEEFYSAFRAPDFIPGYEIQSHLGSGAFGEVYKARKRSIGKAFAIKFLRLDEGSNEKAVLRELEQVRLFASIDHPNLVTIEDMGVVMGVPYLVMGYAGEETLERRLGRGELDRESAMRIFVQVCRGVLALHDRRLAHFDLKPGNVFLKGSIARVGDYGLSSLLTEGRRTLSYGRGTPRYMAPEMLRSRADHRADIYSLGVILYECLALRLPFAAETPACMVVRESDDPPPFPDGFPAELRSVVERCLHLDPDARYGSVHELLAELGQPGRLGDSIRLRPGLAPESGAPGDEAESGGARTRASGPGELKRAAAELARGAVGLARGVWEGVRERAGSPPSSPPEAGAGSQVGAEVVSIEALEEPRSVEPPSAVTPRVESRSPIRAPYGPEPSGGTVPVPPRAEGGVLGTVTASLVLGTEILGALVTGPALYFAGRLGRASDRLALGVPGVLGSLVRFSIFLLVLALFGGLSACVVLIAVALNS